MEHGHDLTFSISVLSNEINRLNALKKLIKVGHIVRKQLNDKISSVQGVLNICQSKKSIGNTKYGLMILRRNLYWLEKQEKQIPSNREIIEEIELVTKLVGEYGRIKTSD
jgi:hypothetical protein